MLNKESIFFENDFFGLFKYKVCCFLNARNKTKRWKGLSYVKWDNGVFDLNLIVEKTKLDLIRWFDNLPDFEERKGLALKNKFTDDDIDCIKVLFSRLGYMFRINKNRTDKDYRLFFFVTQLINLKNDSFNGRDNLMTSLCQQLLCELFMPYEYFSRFSVNDEGVLFKTENIGCVNLVNVINLFFLDNKTESSHELGRFYLSLTDFLFVNDGVKYHYHFDDKNEKYVYPMIFIRYINDEKKDKELFSILGDILSPLQSTNEVFISNMLLMNFIFYFLKDNPSNLLKIKSYLNDGEIFFRFFESVIKRRLIIGKQHFSDLGLDDYLLRIKLNETQFYNILYEE